MKMMTLNIQLFAHKKGQGSTKNGKAKKIIVFKYNQKKNYRRKQGHRQPYTKVEVKKIVVK